MGIEDIFTALGKSESEGLGGYSAENDEGYVGKYQFGEDRLTDFRKATGKDFTMDEFQANPDLQEEAVRWHQTDVLEYAENNGLDKLYGEKVGGVLINDNSVLAMAHLGGRFGMRKFIESGGSEDSNKSDSNGTSLRDYGQKFSGQFDSPSPKYRPEGLGATTEFSGQFDSPSPKYRPKGLEATTEYAEAKSSIPPDLKAKEIMSSVMNKEAGVSSMVESILGKPQSKLEGLAALFPDEPLIPASETNPYVKLDTTRNKFPVGRNRSRRINALKRFGLDSLR